MTKQAVIEKTLSYLNNLPDEKPEEILDYVEYITSKYNDAILQAGIHALVSSSTSFDFLKEEADLYTLADIKEVNK